MVKYVVTSLRLQERFAIVSCSTLFDQFLATEPSNHGSDLESLCSLCLCGLILSVKLTTINSLIQRSPDLRLQTDMQLFHYSLIVLILISALIVGVFLIYIFFGLCWLGIHNWVNNGEFRNCLNCEKVEIKPQRHKGHKE